MICYGDPPPCAHTLFLGFCRHFSCQRGVRGAIIHYPVVFVVWWVVWEGLASDFWQPALYEMTACCCCHIAWAISSQYRFVGLRLRGRTWGYKCQSAVFCGLLRFLRFPGKTSHFSANICVSQMLCFPGEGENQRESARICENLRLGSVCPLRFVSH